MRLAPWFIKRIYTGYIDSFKGLSKEIWWLSFITLLNRAGTMVIPFLSLYLNKNMGLSLELVGWIMTAFGLGSVVGTWFGGWLTDRLGYYTVMWSSLVVSGLLFVNLQFLVGFWPIVVGIFVLMVAADSFRPAIFVAIDQYSKPENRTRSVTLVRLAINLGVVAGPALGGFIITASSYAGLFWIDGLTCIFAALLLLQLLNPKKIKPKTPVETRDKPSVYSDRNYWVFFISMVFMGLSFMQLFSTVPLYYKERHFLSEFEIGLLMGLNGLLIFVFEMPLVKYAEKKIASAVWLMFIGTLLTALSFLALNLTPWIGILIVGMVLVTFGEMLGFPFSNTYALSCAEGKNKGEYMALYSMSFSVAHIFGHNGGMRLIANWGYDFTWYVMFGLGLLSCFCLLFLKQHPKKA